MVCNVISLAIFAPIAQNDTTKIKIGSLSLMFLLLNNIFTYMYHDINNMS